MAIEDHSINRFSTYGQLSELSIPAWAELRLKQLYTDCEPSLDQALNAAISAKKDLNDYQPHIQDKMRAEILIKPRSRLHGTIREHLKETRENVDRIQNKILAVSLPKQAKDPQDRMNNTLRNQEIRSLLRSEPDLEKRKTLITENPEYLKAVSSHNDGIIPKNLLTELRRTYAFQINPDLLVFENQTKKLAELVRQKSGEVNATQICLYTKEDLPDPLSRSDHFQTFTPQTEFEAELAAKSINRERETNRRIDSKNSSIEEN